MIRVLMSVLVLAGSMTLLNSDSKAAGDDREIGALAGIVVAGDRPVPGATVVLKNLATDRRIRTRTDADGRFAFRRIPAGRYLVIARKDRLGGARERVVVAPRETTRVKLELKRRS